MTEFVIKDSGERQEYCTGMVRDTQWGKARFSLLRPEGVPYEEQFLTRCAMHMTKGIVKYGPRNWEKAHTQEELDRFQDSAERHLHQWLAGETEEDHAAAVVFNLLAAETVKYKMAQAKPQPKTIGHMGIDGLSISIPVTGWTMENLAGRGADLARETDERLDG